MGNTDVCKESWITIICMGSGFGAAHVGIFIEDELGGEYPDIIQTGIGRFKTSEEAKPEAEWWAKAEEIEFKSYT